MPTHSHFSFVPFKPPESCLIYWCFHIDSLLYWIRKSKQKPHLPVNWTRQFVFVMHINLNGTNCICSLEMSHSVKQQIAQWAERTQDAVAMIKLCARHHIEFWCWDISALVAPYLAPLESLPLSRSHLPHLARHLSTCHQATTTTVNTTGPFTWGKAGRCLDGLDAGQVKPISSILRFRTAACFHHLSVSAGWFFRFFQVWAVWRIWEATACRATQFFPSTYNRGNKYRLLSFAHTIQTKSCASEM